MAIPVTQETCFSQMPPDMLEAAGKSALYSFVVGSLFCNVTLGLYSAVGSAAASLIDSMIRPVINSCFDRSERAEPLSCYSFTKMALGFIIWSGLVVLAEMALEIELQVGMIASLATFVFLWIIPHSGVPQKNHRDAMVIPLLFV